MDVMPKNDSGQRSGSAEEPDDQQGSHPPTELTERTHALDEKFLPDHRTIFLDRGNPELPMSLARTTLIACLPQRGWPKPPTRQNDSSHADQQPKQDRLKSQRRIFKVNEIIEANERIERR